MDKAGHPYLTHLISVAIGASQLTAAEFSEEAFVVGLLHDSIEDGYAENAEIRLMFGTPTLDAVLSVSRLKDSETYAEFIERARQHPIGRLVKIADLQDNLRPERIDRLELHKSRSLKDRYEKAMSTLAEMKSSPGA